MNKKASDKLIVVLDFANLERALSLVEELSDCVQMFKVGNQLFTSAGPAVIRMLKEKQKRVFLDLKFHDIPNTVMRAAESATALGVDMFNVHSSGGNVMMQAVAEATKLKAEELRLKKPIVLGVTVLTSIGEEQLIADFGTTRRLTEQVAYLAKLTQRSGLDGVVASPREIDLIKKTCGEGFVVVTPGVRPKWALQNDQERVMTPGEAIAAGADYIVIGRPIYNSEHPREATMAIIEEIEQRI